MIHVVLLDLLLGRLHLRGSVSRPFPFLVLVLLLLLAGSLQAQEDYSKLDIGWKILVDPKAPTKPETFDRWTYSAEQMHISNLLLNWMQQTYIPRGCLGMGRRLGNTKPNEYDSTVIAEPHRYGAIGRFYHDLRKDANGKWNATSNTYHFLRIAVNGNIGENFKLISTPEHHYFTLPGMRPGAHTVQGVKMGYEPDGPREETVYPGREATVSIKILIQRRRRVAAGVGGRAGAGALGRGGREPARQPQCAEQGAGLEHREAVDKRVADLLCPLIDQDLSVVFYDMTTIRAEGQSEQKNDLRQFGKGNHLHGRRSEARAYAVLEYAGVVTKLHQPARYHRGAHSVVIDQHDARMA